MDATAVAAANKSPTNNDLCQLNTVHTLAKLGKTMIFSIKRGPKKFFVEGPIRIGQAQKPQSQNPSSKRGAFLLTFDKMPSVKEATVPLFR